MPTNIKRPAWTYARVVVRIEALPLSPSPDDIDQLAELLVDAIDSGASVSFLAPLPVQQARDWWKSVITTAGARSVILVARVESDIVGTVQLAPAWPPNQPHRAEVTKLLVHRRARRRGVGRELMRALERHADRARFSLLTLDTQRGEAAERLYRALGWTTVGVIPGYFLNHDGTLGDTVVMYKRLEPAALGEPIDD